MFQAVVFIVLRVFGDLIETAVATGCRNEALSQDMVTVKKKKHDYHLCVLVWILWRIKVKLCKTVFFFLPTIGS